jgi:hypothetical protein
MRLSCDLGTRIHRQEAEAPNSVKGRRLNAQVQEEQKGNSGGRLFYRDKKQAHYPPSPCGPKLLAWHSGTSPLLTKPNRTREAEDEEVPRTGNAWVARDHPQLSQPSTGRRGEAASPVWGRVGQGRVRRVTKNILA